MGRKLLVSLIGALLACVSGAQDVGLLLGLVDREGNASMVATDARCPATLARSGHPRNIQSQVVAASLESTNVQKFAICATSRRTVD